MTNQGQEPLDDGGQEQIYNPHDRFLKLTLDDVEKVQATLEGVLPDWLVAQLRFSTLQKEDTSYIDQRLKQYFSDIVYSCETQEGIPLKIAFLFEHKSYPPDYPHLQLLRYMLEIWERQAKEKKALNLVLPILLYHGKEVWEYRSFPQYFDGEIDERLGQFAPFFDFLRVNLQASSYAEINERFHLDSVRIAFRLMKSIRDSDLLNKLHEALDGLRDLVKNEQGQTFYETIIVYLYHVSRTDKQEIMEKLYRISQGLGIYPDSPAMQLILQGREEANAEWEKKLAAKMAEAQRAIEKEQKKAIEAKRKVEEARKKEEETKKKALEEKKAAILNLLNAHVPKETIAAVYGMSVKELDAYINV